MGQSSAQLTPFSCEAISQKGSVQFTILFLESHIIKFTTTKAVATTVADSLTCYLPNDLVGEIFTVLCLRLRILKKIGHYSVTLASDRAEIGNLLHSNSQDKTMKLGLGASIQDVRDCDDRGTRELRHGAHRSGPATVEQRRHSRKICARRPGPIPGRRGQPFARAVAGTRRALAGRVARPPGTRYGAATARVGLLPRRRAAPRGYPLRLAVSPSGKR